MNVKEENICRLCLKVAGNDFQIIDENTRKIFEVLLLRVSLDISKDPIICKECTEVAEKSFDFKSTCINTQELQSPVTIDENRATLKLENVFKVERDVESVDDFICRFCLNRISGCNFILLDTFMNDITFRQKLQMLMPEMDFDNFENPVICTTCKQNLECYIKFVEQCLDVEEDITKYMQHEATRSSAQVKLSDVLCFKNILESNYIHIPAIKQEKVFHDVDEVNFEVYSHELTKTEDTFDAKDEVVNFNKTTYGTSDMPLYQLNVPYGCETQNSSFSPTEAEDETKHRMNIKTQKLIDKKVTETKTHRCSICTFETRHKNSLRKHMLIHKDITQVEMHKCSMCSFKTKYKGDLIRHTLVHKDITDVKMYKCAMCTYETKHKGGLKSHVLIHKDITDVKTYKCSMCTYETKYGSSIGKHMLIHKSVTEVETLKCSMCTFETRHTKSLTKHMLVHKDITEVQMYKCALCTYKTKYKGGLKSHVLTHRDITEVETYKCPMCTYEAKQRIGLTKHMLIHKDSTEVEMHKCPTCTYKTKRKGTLTRHMLIHKDVAEVEMYQCTKCNYKTKHKYSVKKHKCKSLEICDNIEPKI